MFSGKSKQLPGGIGRNKGQAGGECTPTVEILGFSPGSKSLLEVSAGATGPTEVGANAKARGVLWGQGFLCSKTAFLCLGPTGQLPGNSRGADHLSQYVTGSRLRVYLIPFFPKR